MRCAVCDGENANDNRFCILCGSLLAAEQPAADAEPDDAMEALRADVRRLSAEVAQLRRAMSAHGLAARPAEAREASGSAAGPARAPGPGARPVRAPESAPAAQRSGVVHAVNWEIILGGNWLARVGVLALIIGTAFFLKLAFDNNWIGETERVLLGIVGGLALVAAGEYWRQRYAIYSQALAGGGVAILYLSVFAAYSFYDLIATYPAIGVLAFISVGAAALALRHESTSLAILGIGGAFLAPFVIGAFDEASAQGAGPGYDIVVYVLLVDVLVLALSTFRNWRWFTLLTLVASLASVAAWLDYSGPDVDPIVSQAFLTGVFLIFVAATTMYHVLWRRVPQPFDHSLMVLNAGAYLALTYATLSDDFRVWMGLFALGLSLFYVLLGAVALRQGREQYYLALMALGIAAVMLAVAAPVQLGGPWFGAAWAVQGVLLIWLSFRLGRVRTRLSGYLALALGAGWLLFVGTPMAITEYLTPFANTYAPSFAMATAALYAAALVLRRNGGALHYREEEASGVMIIGGNVMLAALFATQLGSTWLPIAWSVQALAMLWLWRAWGLWEMRWSGCALLAVVAVRLVGWETVIDTDEFRAFLNGRMLAFACGIAALYAAAVMLRGRLDDASERERGLLVPSVLASASFLTLWILGAEAFALVDSGIIEVSGDAEFHAKSLALSLVLAVYASAALAVGVLRRVRAVRIAGLALLAVPVVKLFLVDSFALEQGYRVAAFMCLGALLLAGGFLYQRYQEAIREFLFEQRGDGGIRCLADTPAGGLLRFRPHPVSSTGQALALSLRERGLRMRPELAAGSLG